MSKTGQAFPQFSFILGRLLSYIGRSIETHTRRTVYFLTIFVFWSMFARVGVFAVCVWKPVHERLCEQWWCIGGNYVFWLPTRRWLELPWRFLVELLHGDNEWTHTHTHSQYTHSTHTNTADQGVFVKMQRGSAWPTFKETSWLSKDRIISFWGFTQHR